MPRLQFGYKVVSREPDCAFLEPAFARTGDLYIPGHWTPERPQAPYFVWRHRKVAESWVSAVEYPRTGEVWRVVYKPSREKKHPFSQPPCSIQEAVEYWKDKWNLVLPTNKSLALADSFILIERVM